MSDMKPTPAELWPDPRTPLEKAEARSLKAEKELQHAKEQNRKWRIACRYGMHEDDQQYLPDNLDDETLAKFGQRLGTKNPE